jgi:hypothetical protein
MKTIDKSEQTAASHCWSSAKTVFVIGSSKVQSLSVGSEVLDQKCWTKRGLVQ